MLSIYYANKTEVLAQKLSALIALDPLSVFHQETIVVESSAMKDWLNVFFSQQLGIAADIDFPFAAKVLWGLYRQVMPDLPEQSCFDRNILTLRIFALLQQGTLPQGLADYVARLTTEKSRLSLAAELAGLYDQYQIYRPQWLKNWQEGKYQFDHSLQFQAQLWQQLFLQIDKNDPPRSDIFFSALEKIAKLEPSEIGYDRLHFFLPSNIPASYLAVLECLAQSIPVNVFIINPSYDFWLQCSQHKHIEAFDIDADENALLLLLGKQQQLFLQQLQGLEKAEVIETFIDDPRDNLLNHLQSSITHFKQGDAAAKLNFKRDECNLSIHSCHHRMREVQVLHDHILSLLDNDQDLQLQDIAVMVPDIDNYAPYFASVFNNQEQVQALDYSISERKDFQDIAVFRIAINILRMALGNFKRDDFEALLGEPLLLDSLGIDDADVLKPLLKELNVRFALDDASWHKLGAQVVSLSFEQAADRLLKSYASEGSDDCVSGIEANIAEQSAHLLLSLELLKPLQAVRKQCLPLQRWCALLTRLMQSLLDAELELASEQLPQLIEALQSLEQEQAMAKFNEPVGLLLFIELLEQKLQAASQQHQFKPGKINIASLLPMRNLPFKVVCLLGMNDGEFPAVPRFDYLDLMQRHPEPGDRDRSQEQRYLFLQALLSAKHYLYISFIGQSAYDNSEQLPSLLLDELMTFIDRYYWVDNQKASTQLLHKHPLQSFDARYFSDDSTLFSYNAMHYQQSQAVFNKTDESAFIEQPLSLVPMKTISLYQFYQGLLNPAQFLMQGLNASLLQELQQANQHFENFASDGLDKYQLLQALFWQHIDSPELAADVQINAWVRQGLLPQAVFAKLELDDMQQQLESLLVSYQALALGPFNDNAALTVDFENGQQLQWAATRLNLEKQQYLSVLSRNLKAKHFFKAWLEHLVLQSQVGAFSSYLLATDAAYKLEPVEKSVANDYLEKLLQPFNNAAIDASAFCTEAMFDYWQTVLTGKEDKAYSDLQQLLAKDNEDGIFADVHWQHVYQGKTLEVADVVQYAESFMPELFAQIKELTV